MTHSACGPAVVHDTAERVSKNPLRGSWRTTSDRDHLASKEEKSIEVILRLGSFADVARAESCASWASRQQGELAVDKILRPVGTRVR